MKNKKWVIFWLIIALWLLGGIGILMTAWQTLLPTQNAYLELIKTSLLILGGLGVVLPTYLNVWQSLENNKLIETKNDFDRVENSFRILEKWNDVTLMATRRFTRDIKDKRSKISDDDLVNEINTVEGLKESILMVFNYWELVRLSVKYNRVNEKMLCEAYGELFVEMYERFKPWINKQDERYRHDLKELYLRWKGDH